MQLAPVIPHGIFIFTLYHQPLGKRIKFSQSLDHQDIVIGIVSDIRSWKLCYQLNQLLHLQLRNVREADFEGDFGLSSGPLNPSLADDSVGVFQDTLFDHSREFTPEMYEDSESFPSQEYLLYTKDPQNLPPEARPFRFFLLIRSESEPQLLATKVLESLQQSPAITFAADLSGDKHLQSLLP